MKLKFSSTARENGFTLIEVLIAVTIFAIALLGINSMQLSAVRGNSNANWLSQAATLASDRIETLMSLPYDDPDLDDTEGDGKAGLHNTTTDPDHSVPSGIFTIYWNIAVDEPAANCKLIRVIVTWNDEGRTKSLHLDTVKANTI